MTYGYIRVSTLEQNEARQIDAMDSAGISRECLFIDKRSGKDFNRPAWKRLKRTMKHGDLLVVQSLDRLGRNYEEIIEEWQGLVKAKGANIRVLDMPLLDTTNKENGLLGRFVSDIVLQILSFVSENERRNIKERQRQGIAAAKARGVRFGRPRWEPTAAFIVAAEAAKRGELPWSKAAHDFGMSESNFRYHAKTLTPLAKRNGF